LSEALRRAAGVSFDL